jgi:hypothetical protein
MVIEFSSLPSSTYGALTAVRQRELTGHCTPSPSLETSILSTVAISWECSNSFLAGLSTRFPILGSVRPDPRSCECRCDLHVPLQATEEERGNLSPMGHLQLHKCCDTAAIKSSVLDSPQSSSLSRWEHSTDTRRAIRHPGMQLAAS